MLPNSKMSSSPPARISTLDMTAMVITALTGICFFLADNILGRYPFSDTTAICREAPNSVPLIALLVASTAPRITSSVPRAAQYVAGAGSKRKFFVFDNIGGGDSQNRTD